MKPNIPKKYQPKGFEILYEDRDLIAGNKAPGVLTVAALWNKEDTVHRALNMYVRKGQAKSRKCVYVVHRLDQATTGILLFAKSEEAQTYLKENWKNTDKVYYAVVNGHPAKKTDTISSYLEEDEDYVVHSSKDSSSGKLSHTRYEVVGQNARYSLLKIDLLTGRKNQIRVHLSDIGHPVVGDERYGKGGFKNLALHAFSIEFNHPHSEKRMRLTAPVPDYFGKLGFKV